MYDLRLQAIRAALAELQGSIKADSGPAAHRTIHLVSTLLANAIARESGEVDVHGMEDELARQRDLIAREQQIIADAALPADRADLSESALTAYVRAHLGGGVSVAKANTLVGGASKQTVILTLHGGEAVGNALVLRRDLAGGPVESEAADEFPITRELHRRGLAVAEPIWADRAPPFGGTCMVTRLVAGEQAMNLTDSGERQGGRAACLALARVLASIHATPLAGLAVTRDKLNGTLRDHTFAMIDAYEDQWKRRRVDHSPTIAAALAWLRANVPAEGQVSLVHGDASLRNLMMHEGRESAILDWELWHVGDHQEDIAYCQYDVAPRLEWSEFLAEYLSHGGKPVSQQAIAFWSMFGAVRNMIFAAVLAHSYATREHPPAPAMFMALAGGRPLTEMVAQMLAEMAAGGVLAA